MKSKIAEAISLKYNPVAVLFSNEKLNEGKSDKPRGVVGLIDISARKHLEKDLLSFSVPYKMFPEMEGNVEESFLNRDEWLEIKKRN